jgi:hypothetical protein
MITVQHNFLSSSMFRHLTVVLISSVIQFWHSLLQWKSHHSAVRHEILFLQKWKYFFMQCFQFSLPSERAMIFGMFPFLGLLRFVLLLRAIFRGKWVWGNGGMTWQRIAEVLGGKPTILPPSPPQIPHVLTRKWTRSSVVRGRRLTAWAMTQTTAPKLCVFNSSYLRGKVIGNRIFSTSSYV